MTQKVDPDARADDDLVDSARDGDVAAFEQLVRLHYAQVFGVARGILGRDTDAEDATQDTFVRAWRALPSFRGDSAFTTWLYRIATNVSLTLVTRRRDAATNKIPERGTRASAPDARLEDRERLGVVQQVMDGLPPDARAAFVLRDIQGLTYEQIADALDISLSAVKSRIFRARRAVADGLLAYDTGGTGT